ncbi:MAG: hypothetical protein H6622_03685 [Halobacteriovoraceae bacterium]|nr:hypothetical protein [Halobacteriovoraceae bacterium]
MSTKNDLIDLMIQETFANTIDDSTIVDDINDPIVEILSRLTVRYYLGTYIPKFKIFNFNFGEDKLMSFPENWGIFKELRGLEGDRPYKCRTVLSIDEDHLGEILNQYFNTDTNFLFIHFYEKYFLCLSDDISEIQEAINSLFERKVA